MFKNLRSITQYLRIPYVCVLCKEYHRHNFAICNNCFNLIKKIEHACIYCAEPLPDNSICGHCIKKPPSFDNAFIPYYFEEPLRQLIHSFKYRQSLYLTATICKLITRNIPAHALSTECLVPVPMHSQKIKKRGFNHTAEMTKLLSKELKIPYILDLCQKIKSTPSQVELKHNERAQNLKNAFMVTKTDFIHVTIIDDIMTTGHTAEEVAHALKLQGIQRVDVWCCARAVKVQT